MELLLRALRSMSFGQVICVPSQDVLFLEWIGVLLSFAQAACVPSSDLHIGPACYCRSPMLSLYPGPTFQTLYCRSSRLSLYSGCIFSIGVLLTFAYAICVLRVYFLNCRVTVFRLCFQCTQDPFLKLECYWGCSRPSFLSTQFVYTPFGQEQRFSLLPMPSLSQDLLFRTGVLRSFPKALFVPNSDMLFGDRSSISQSFAQALFVPKTYFLDWCVTVLHLGRNCTQFGSTFMDQRVCVFLPHPQVHHPTCLQWTA